MAVPETQNVVAPMAAMGSGAVPTAAIEAVAAKMRAIVQDSQGTLAQLCLSMSELSDNQLGQIPIEMVCGGGFSDNMPFGSGTEIAVEFVSGMECNMSLAEASPNARLTMRYGPEGYDFVARNAHAIVAFLDIPANQPITVNSLLTLISHGAFRDAYMPGNLVTMKKSGYVIDVTGGIIIINLYRF